MTFRVLESSIELVTALRGIVESLPRSNRNLADQLQRAARLQKGDTADEGLDKLEGLLARSDSGQAMSEAVPYLTALLAIPLGARQPTGAARSLLRVADRHPEALLN